MGNSRTPEGLALDSICEYLNLRKYFFFRINNIGVYDPSKQIHRALPKWAMKGVADIFVLHKGGALFVEVKSQVGRQSPEQRNFEALVLENGGRYIVARSIDDLREIGI